MRVEHEYQRKGALAYLAAYDVHRPQVIGRMEPTTGIEPFGRLVEQVMTTEPYASADRVFWVVDNGSSHRGQASIDRMAAAWPTAQLVHLPVHASWLDQIEIFYSIVQRKVLTPNDLTDLDASPNGYWPSRTATTPPPHPSAGDSPAQTWTGSSGASPPTTPRPWPPDQPTAYFRRRPLRILTYLAYRQCPPDSPT